MKRLLVLASGRGSNFRALQEATRAGKLRVEIVALGVPRPGTGAAQIAEASGVSVMDASAEGKIIDFFRAERLDGIALAGYMKILTSELIEALRGKDGLSRIMNIHPSLLPAFPGVNSYRQAFSAGVRETGVTAHLVEKEVDGGPILDQRSFRIDTCRSAEEVETRGLPIEHELYPQTIDWFINGEYRVETREGKPYVARA
jgi:phosphoribosylglycinamide formyltransferase-1